MRQTLAGERMVWLLIAGCMFAPAAARADEVKAGRPPKVIASDAHHNEFKFDLADPKQKAEFWEKLDSGHLEHWEVEKPLPNPLDIKADLGLWALVIFLALVFILQKYAWGPMLQGLQKREATIRDSVEEAQKARAETLQITAEFKAKMDQAYAEIPKIMEQARRDADAFKEEMRTQTAKDIQAERQRLRREIETARDQALQELWNQAAQLATLISAKAIGRSLTEADHRRLLDESIAELGQSANRG